MSNIMNFNIVSFSMTAAPIDQTDQQRDFKFSILFCLHLFFGKRFKNSLIFFSKAWVFYFVQ